MNILVGATLLNFFRQLTRVKTMSLVTKRVRET